jgi:hypothetical protein
MRVEKHVESLKEVMDEIKTSLRDPDGLLKHQRRLAMMLSIGITDLVEIYFHKLGIMKSGARIKHTWFRKKDLMERLENQVISSLNNVENLETVVEICREIEESRNDLAYGSPLSDEKFLKKKIDLFLELKSLIERRVGDVIEAE